MIARGVTFSHKQVDWQTPPQPKCSCVLASWTSAQKSYLMPLCSGRGAIQSLVLVTAQAHVVTDDVQHPHHLAEDQHPAGSKDSMLGIELAQPTTVARTAVKEHGPAAWLVSSGQDWHRQQIGTGESARVSQWSDNMLLMRGFCRR